MEIGGNTVLITGGASGIGYTLAERFLAAGSKVIILGRREDRLKAAQAEHPELIVRRCDVSDEAERLELFDWVTRTHGEVNVLVNNAGIQRNINLTTADRQWSWYSQEIAINLEAPIHLSMLFAPYFLEKGGTIVNVSSRLGLMPAAWVPIYTATKAALHFFTKSLRMQLQKKAVHIVEILPPMVDTDLSGPGNQATGIPVDEFVDAVMEKLEAGAKEIGYKSSQFALSDSYTKQIAAEESDRFWQMFSAKLPEFKNLLD